MTNVYFDAAMDDPERRRRLFAGELFVYSATAATRALRDFAWEMISEAFAPHEPRAAQHALPAERYAELLGRLKPAFTHHARSKQLILAVLAERGCSEEDTYVEVPKMRASTSGDYYTAGLAYAWHPHRDTWFSAPQCQVNWWVPLTPLSANDCVAFHPQYWAAPVDNSSSTYNYHRWNVQHRGTHLTRYIHNDPRPMPAPTAPLRLEHDLRVPCPEAGLLMFSGAHLHSSVPNTSGSTRFSVDFRTAHLDDLTSGAGAPNIDSACTGTALAEFRRARDGGALPEQVLSFYSDGTESLGSAVYEPEPGM